MNTLTNNTLFDASFWAHTFAEMPTGDTPKVVAGSAKAKEMWNERAASFAHKRKRSGYIDKLIELLALAPDESVFDMGAGSGTLSIPLAQRGHTVYAVDFSPSMLDELHAAARLAGVEVATFERSWQENWEGLPKANVAVASRSFVTNDLASACAKLEAHADTRVAISMIAGETPLIDLRVEHALGRATTETEQRRGFIAAINYLFALGRRPRVDYITYPRRMQAPSISDLETRIAQTVNPQNDFERKTLATFVKEHAIPSTTIGEDGTTEGVMLDYDQQVVWGFICWDVPSARTK